MIKFVARADLQHLRRFLDGKQTDAPQEALQVLDIVLRELSSQRCDSFLSMIYIIFKFRLFSGSHINA